MNNMKISIKFKINIKNLLNNKINKMNLLKIKENIWAYKTTKSHIIVQINPINKGTINLI